MKKDHTSIWLVLTNDVTPRDSHDDKILPEHPKFNPKVKSFELWNYKKLRINMRCTRSV